MTKTRISRDLGNVEGLTHYLPGVPASHKCSGGPENEGHGHSFKVEVYIEGKLDSRGFCGGVDTAEIETIWGYIYPMLDHKKLMNRIPGLENPTTEVFAQWVWNRFNMAWGDQGHRISLLGVHVQEGFMSHAWVEGHLEPGMVWVK